MGDVLGVVMMVVIMVMFVVIMVRVMVMIMIMLDDNDITNSNIIMLINGHTIDTLKIYKPK